MSALEWASYHAADRLIGLSPGVVDGIGRRGISSQRICAIPNGCDLSLFQSASESWLPDGISDQDLVAVYSGTHGAANGLDAVLDAARELKSRNRSDIKIVLVGEGSAKADLQGRAEMQGLSNVVFHGAVSKLEVAGLLAKADVGLQVLANVPAFYDGTSPNKFFDYLSAGVPVLINYPGWLAKLVDESRCGLSVAPDSPGAFADALERLADQREELVAMGQKAEDLAAERFARDCLSDQFALWLEGTLRHEEAVARNLKHEKTV